MQTRNSSSTAVVTLAPFSSSAAWHDALSHPDGRERLFRLVQYALKLVRGSLAGRETKNAAPHIARILILESTLGTARQVWRLFKWSGFYSKTSIRALLDPGALSNTGPSLTTALATLQEACLASYLALDNIAFLTKTTVLAGDTQAASRRAARAWLAASVLGLLNAARRLAAARGALRSAPRKPAAETRARRADARRAAARAVKYAGDAVVAYGLASGGGGATAHPAVVGLCGVASSVVGFADVWPRRVASSSAAASETSAMSAASARG